MSTNGQDQMHQSCTRPCPQISGPGPDRNVPKDAADNSSHCAREQLHSRSAAVPANSVCSARLDKQTTSRQLHSVKGSKRCQWTASGLSEVQHPALWSLQTGVQAARVATKKTWRWLCLHRGRDLPPGEDLELTSPNWIPPLFENTERITSSRKWPQTVPRRTSYRLLHGILQIRL